MISDVLDYKIVEDYRIFNIKYQNDEGYYVYDNSCEKEQVEIYTNDLFIEFPDYNIRQIFGTTMDATDLFWIIKNNRPVKLKISIDTNSFNGSKKHILIPIYLGCQFYNFYVKLYHKSLPYKIFEINFDLANMINKLFFENKIKLERKKEVSVWVKWESLDNYGEKNEKI